jgi:uncharacterized protein
LDATLVSAALLMGVSGAPHCAAMCVAPCSVIVGKQRAIGPALAPHLGRVAGYCAAGALAATGVIGLGTLEVAAPVLRPIWTMLQVAALALGIWLAWTARAPRWSWLGPRAAATAAVRPVRWFRAIPATGRASAAGALWFAVPCGLLQSALLVSALASSAAAGATVMAAFATTSALGLWLAPRLWMRLRRSGHAQRMAFWSVRAAGLLLAGSSLFALWHGLGSALCVAAPS